MGHVDLDTVVFNLQAHKRPQKQKSEIASEAISRQKFKMVVQNFIHCFERVNRIGHKPQLLLKAKNKLFKKKHDNEISTV